MAQCHLGLGRRCRRLGEPEQAKERLTPLPVMDRVRWHDVLAVDAAGDRVGTFAFRFEAIGTQWEIETAGAAWAVRCASAFSSGSDSSTPRTRGSARTPSWLGSPPPRTVAASTSPTTRLPSSISIDRLHAATGGAVDPLVGRDLELLGYDRTYSLTPAPDRLRAEAHARGRARWSKDVVRDGTSLVTRRPLVIDVGAAGKGYLVDIVSRCSARLASASSWSTASGDLRHSGDPASGSGSSTRSTPDWRSAWPTCRTAPCAHRRSPGAPGATGCTTCSTPGRVPRFGTWSRRGSSPTRPRPPMDWRRRSSSRARSHLAEVFRFSYVRMFADGRAEISAELRWRALPVSAHRPPRQPSRASRRGRTKPPTAGRKAMGMTTLGRRLGRTTMAAISASVVIAPWWPTGTLTVRHRRRLGWQRHPFRIGDQQPFRLCGRRLHGDWLSTGRFPRSSP